MLCLGLAFWWGMSTDMGPWTAVWVTLVLSVMEVTLSFDNAVVNAAVLKEMDEWWRKLFLTLGILIAVFGMRLVFPVVIVAVATGDGLVEVSRLAIENPDAYSQHLHDHHVSIASFGGMFLLLVCLRFLFDHERELHWLGRFEAGLAKLGRLHAFELAVALSVLLIMQFTLDIPPEKQLTSLVSGVLGIVLFVLVDSVDAFFELVSEVRGGGGMAKRAGLAGFLYLEVLDASFSFDGVIGAFAITRDVVIIMLGLGVGAMFVRSLTVYLVHRGTLDEYVFLEHGAHYAIGALAVIMLLSVSMHVPEAITGLIGLAFILVSVWSSVQYRKQHEAIGG